MKNTTKISTKKDSDLRQVAVTICENLAPLVGCNLNSQKWSPATAFRVCEPLSIILNGEISNLPKRVYADDLFSYVFTPNVTSKGFEIYQKVNSFNKEVMDESYLYSSTNYFTTSMDSRTKLKITATTSILYDSTIFSATYKNSQLVISEQYKQLFTILLYGFTIRYYLYEYAYNFGDLDDVINNININLLVDDINYVKFMLCDMKILKVGDTEHSIHFICSQLNTLIRSLMQINTELLEYLR